ERIEQVWFAGVHSNVGGGYPRQGMSLVALEWIMAKAEAAPHNLRFITDEREMLRFHADVDDKLYDSRAGLGVFYRWLPRNPSRLCADNGSKPKAHRSVYERIARNTEGYAPGSVPPDAEVISLSQPSAVTDAVSDLVRTQHGTGGPLLAREPGTERLGRWSYWLFVWGIVIAGLLVLRQCPAAAVLGPGGWREVGPNVAGTIVSSQWLVLIFEVLWRNPWLVGWQVVTLAIAMWVDKRLDARYSDFWHRDQLRLRLRQALGLGGGDDMATFNDEAVMLTLAALTYRGFQDVLGGRAHEGIVSGALVDGLSTLAPVKDQWELVWGPTTDRGHGVVDSNMMYVVRSRQAANRLVVAIRGTNPISFTDWVFGDLWVGEKVDWPYATPADPAAISKSTALG